LKFGAVNIITEIVEVTIRNVGEVVFDVGAGTVNGSDNTASDFHNGVFIAATNVVNFTNNTLVDDSFETAGDIRGMDEGTSVVTSSLDGELLAFRQEHQEARNDLFGVLEATIDVVTTGDDDGEVEGDVIGLGDEFSGGLGGGVGVGGVEHSFFHLR